MKLIVRSWLSMLLSFIICIVAYAGNKTQSNKKNRAILKDFNTLNIELVSAVRNGNIDAVNQLIKNGADVNTIKQNRGNYRGKTDQVDIYEDLFATLHNTHKNSYTCTIPLIIASGRGYDEIVKTLLKKGADVDIKGDVGYTALYAASRQGHTATVELLLKAGASTALDDINGMTQLHLFCVRGMQDEVTSLLKGGADIDIYDNDKWTPLMYAIHHKHHSTIDLLLKAGANPNLKNSNGQTALMIAARLNDYESVKQLLAAGADPRAKDEKGHNSLWHLNQNLTTTEADKRILTDTIWDAMMK